MTDITSAYLRGQAWTPSGGRLSSTDYFDEYHGMTSTDFTIDLLSGIRREPSIFTRLHTLGTGGRLDPEQLKDVLLLLVPSAPTSSAFQLLRGNTGQGVSFDPAPSPAPSAEDSIALIRSALSLNVTELARCLLVERPTIYAWISGRARPRSTNLHRLARLVSIATSWRSHSSEPLGELVRQPSLQGESIVDFLSRESIPQSGIEKLLTQAASRLAIDKERAAEQRAPTVRQILDKHGIVLADSSREADSITRRRLSREEE